MWIVECRKAGTEEWQTSAILPKEDAARQWAYEQARILPDYEFRIRPWPGAPAGADR